MNPYPQSAAVGEADSGVLVSLAPHAVGLARTGRFDSGTAASHPAGVMLLAYDDDDDVDFDDDGFDDDDDGFDDDFEDDYDEDDLDDLDDFDDDEGDYDDFDDDDF